MNHHSVKSRPAAAAGVVGGKTARACDSCILRRARWYCAADDAFLCHPCDSIIHSANPLARRHDRLRLKASAAIPAPPTWHHGFKRKARTPRPHQKPVVPELDSSADEVEEEEEQLLYRVPVFDPALAFGGPTQKPQPPTPPAAAIGVGVEFAPTEIEMAEFAADMESLLGRGLDSGEVFCMAELGLVEALESKGSRSPSKEEGKIREGLSFEMEVDLSRETLELDFGCGSPEMTEETATEEREGSRGMGLRLDYEAVKEAWLVRGSSPWISGERPRLGAEDCWLECMGVWGGEGREGAGVGGIQVMDVGREARVTRYREKRRTRLYSKKIRYEVRKLNAEKRPRMKGRFVKRASFPATVTAAGSGGVQVGYTYGKR